MRNEKIGLKIREHTLQRTPYLLVVGAREAENHKVAVRMQNGQDLGVMDLQEISSRLLAEIKARGRNVLEG